MRCGIATAPLVFLIFNLFLWNRRMSASLLIILSTAASSPTFQCPTRRQAGSSCGWAGGTPLRTRWAQTEKELSFCPSPSLESHLSLWAEEARMVSRFPLPRTRTLLQK